MPDLVLVIGNKNYSSWSLRPWLALRQAGIPFREQKVLLDRADSPAHLAKWSPSSRVPALHDGELVVWDSLAIVEYVAELHPGLWPDDRADRALARSMCAEMHSGFAALRLRMPMDLCGRYPGEGLDDAVRADIARVEKVWQDALARSGGPFLFGARPTAADAYYAPVAGRFRTYAPALGATSERYVETLLATPAMREWEAGTIGEEPMPKYARK